MATLNGTANDDAILGTNTADTINGFAGSDELSGEFGDDIVNGGDGNDILYGGLGNDTLNGEANDDTLVGDLGIDTLNGGGGNDILQGDADGQVDKLSGGSGNDVYFNNEFTDAIFEGAGDGYDVVLTTSDLSMSANVEEARLLGIGNIGIRGNAQDNVLIGNDGSNLFDLQSGGADTVSGGRNSDGYLGVANDDTIVELAGGGINDRIVTVEATYTLPAFVESLSFIMLVNLALVFTGNATANYIVTGEGNDTLNGLGGADTMVGLAGNDTYVVDDIGDIVTESSGIFNGDDTVQSSVTYTLSNDVEALVLTGAAAINGTGNTLSNTLTGNGAVNTLTGGLGNDTLDGGLGADILIGGFGNDTYLVDAAGDQVQEGAGQGNDTVRSLVTFTLGDNVEFLTLTGAGNTNGTGNTSNNIITGNTGNNRLDGQIGNDAMFGGLGNDVYVVDSTLDTVSENIDEGDDRVESSVNFTLSANVERLTLTGASNINGTGNAIANVLIGNAGDNTLSGKAGADTMIGGLGNDTYVVDDALDIVTEGLNAGTDKVLSSVDHVLKANVEDLSLIGTAISGTGNALANDMLGNGLNNTLNGLAGDDVMTGAAGNDTFFVDSVGDLVIENVGGGDDLVNSSIAYTLGDNVEHLTLIGAAAINGTGNILTNVLNGNAAANTLTGLDGADILDGKGGADTMIGGVGSDTYFVDNIGDVVTEAADEGTGDRVHSTRTYALTENVEVLQLFGVSNISGTGNALKNTIFGNSGINRLDGGADIDLLHGGAGNDTYVVDHVSDKTIEFANEGTDTVESSVTFILANHVERLTLTGASIINGTGNTLDNIIIGNAAANTIDGKAGADTMAGGQGDDIYIVDNVGDTVIEGASSGTDLVQSFISYTLPSHVEKLVLIVGAIIDGAGNAAANEITGNSQVNVLSGGLGLDTLRGNAGADDFFFAAANQGLDTIADFVVGFDDLRIDASGFGGGLAAGPLAADRLLVGAATPTATQAFGQFLYNTTSRELFWDFNGVAAGGVIHFATLTGAGILTVNDFEIVA